MQMAILEKLGETIVLTLPAEVIRALRLRAGEELTISVEGERLVLTRMPAIFRDVRVFYQGSEPYDQGAQVAS